MVTNCLRLSGYAHRGIQFGAQNGLSIDLPLNLISFLEVLQFNGADFNVWLSELESRLASQFAARALSRLDEKISGDYILEQREELRKVIQSAREYFLTRSGM